MRLVLNNCFFFQLQSVTLAFMALTVQRNAASIVRTILVIGLRAPAWEVVLKALQDLIVIQVSDN